MSTTLNINLKLLKNENNPDYWRHWFKNDPIKKVYLNDWVVKMRLGGKSTTAKLQKIKSTEDLDVIRRYNLWGYFTLACKIARKVPQYVLPRLIKYR